MRRVLLRPVFSGFVVATVALTACGSDTKSADTTTTTATADPPASTSAPAVPASTNADGSVAISVTVGADDFTTTQGKRVVSVPKGANVTISLTDPAADEEYHLHGYDVEVAATKGKTASLAFTADQTGQFDLESHGTGAVLLVIVVG